MSDSFDPYQSWLGIPPQEQPPSYYRLLGLPPLVTDAELISQASARIHQHLSPLLAGAQAADAQRLLSEVQAAAGCLGDPSSKADYDQQLQRQMSLPPGQAEANRPEMPSAPSMSGSSESPAASPWMFPPGSQPEQAPTETPADSPATESPEPSPAAPVDSNYLPPGAASRTATPEAAPSQPAPSNYAPPTNPSANPPTNPPAASPAFAYGQPMPSAPEMNPPGMIPTGGMPLTPEAGQPTPWPEPQAPNQYVDYAAAPQSAEPGLPPGALPPGAGEMPPTELPMGGGFAGEYGETPFGPDPAFDPYAADQAGDEEHAESAALADLGAVSNEAGPEGGRASESLSRFQSSQTNIVVEMVKVIAGGLVGVVLMLAILRFGFGMDPLKIFGKPKASPVKPAGNDWHRRRRSSSLPLRPAQSQPALAAVGLHADGANAYNWSANPAWRRVVMTTNGEVCWRTSHQNADGSSADGKG